ncbi:hypothetical protein TVAG_340260 [Trichomonas vaginalis G3]|uniref:Uncharacterized protein n=1 Tax=Trichomonas vaginalis (strain ATCC PRA-98 / G3) TaxID=412133 RepID=A2EKE0_TRIV3|nr:hypothetical protein TVAGG3_0979940 [Trichomonas vaginalis G3]EAY06848.1 hypothetical protein TVAG_340260 [Trichomonas vaginalis G3]KAI5489212.1 hypothetical protein TVAGG3_0979940 [Trichomonas vaginalis G3]|eukprot:XP_001319071.1 hypothetical protein [Trichomonas vaginalis G3]
MLALFGIFIQEFTLPTYKIQKITCETTDEFTLTPKDTTQSGVFYSLLGNIQKTGETDSNFMYAVSSGQKLSFTGQGNFEIAFIPVNLLEHPGYCIISDLQPGDYNHYKQIPI